VSTNQTINSLEAAAAFAFKRTQGQRETMNVKIDGTQHGANARQVAGSHYQDKPPGAPQHWDLAVAYQWDFFQYQITKYVMRWKIKHETPDARLQDLKKAAHFVQKYIEEVEAGRWPDDKPFLLGAPVVRSDGDATPGYVNQ
jgi:hypothetical protein